MYLSEVVLEQTSRDAPPSMFGQMERARWNVTETGTLCEGVRLI